MTSGDKSAASRRLAALARARIAGAKWVLVAAAFALVTIALSAGGSVTAAFLAALALVVVAAVAPRGSSRRNMAAERAMGPSDELGGLTALELAAAVPDPLIIFDGNGSVVHANRAAVAAFGQLPAGLLLPIRFRAPELQELLAIATARTGWSGTIDYIERVPMERAFRVTTVALGQRPGLHALVFKDQSEVRRIDRMRADFIANASHELRTPLASIAGFIETLRGPARDDEKTRENFLRIMETQTGRMARLIDDLLSLSRLEMKPLLTAEEKLDIGHLVKNVADALGELAKASGVTIDVRMPDAPIEVPGSRDELIQVFENLLENACKYGQSGGRVDVTIARETSGPKPEVAITIRDYGPGIAEEHIPRVTERFYRADVETGRTQKGTGLGLSIVKHILTRHEGRLSIRSELGNGAAFTVHLPTE